VGSSSSIVRRLTRRAALLALRLTCRSYPALHLYIYTLLERLPTTPPWLLALVFPAKLHSHLVLQLVFLGLYLVQLGLTATIYRQAGVPQLALVPLTLDKRAHSIYMLRLFGDCWAVALVSIAVLIWQRGWWKTGSVVYRCVYSHPLC
jgi:alpha-1,3-mannosyltransferase